MTLTKALAIACVTMFSAQAPQNPDAPPPAVRGADVIRLGVDLVRVDATVTDARGQHVQDLTAADFELLQDGRPQTISTFDYVRLRAPELPLDAVLRPANPGPTRPLAPHEVRRTIALIVDDLRLSLESTARVRAVLQRFLDTQMQPGDLVAILRTGAGMGALQQFTSDRRALQAAADSVRWNLSGRVPAFQSMELDPLDEFRSEVLRAGTLGAVSYVIRGLSELPGRKSVILLSDGFSLRDSDGHHLRVLAALRSVVDASNRAGVVVYGIDMRGLVATGPTASEPAPSNASRKSLALRETQEGMAVLAAETGGLFIGNVNDLSAGLGRVLSDQQGYYLLGYVPEKATFTGPNARFHALRVNVKRPGLRVRSRSGFFSVSDELVRARRPANRMVAAVTSPFAGGDIRLRLSSFFGHHHKVGAFVTSVMHVDARDLTFAEAADGMRTSEVEVLAMTFGENGQVADQTGRRHTFTLTARGYERALSAGLVYHLQVPLKLPGPYQLRVALRDVAGDRIGSASRFIDVPDVKKGRLTLSGLLIQGVEQRVGQAVATGDADDDTRDAPSTLAVRAFRHGSDASYLCSVYNARRGPDGLPRLETEARLYRDGVEVFRTAVRNTIPVPANTEPLVGGVLHLTDTPPGDYVLELIVVDRLDKKATRAAQTIDFSVIR